ncbi:apoptotic chromatin condensation inducer in the nucleus-like isoform X2 [Neltuma alba]|uniref:apoptotic chromatin condensation inducer in the nucleus-like isoform X2 n=1 Tax=Neltuma alba TaxID=207710 RepID=UPI0010A4FAD5|nr:apoptotic chromatin condensation inducer in the nucleus-like isoform X2 [Prosopis alba]XP_028763600.1 apoptotic chromatin condensation inducer in the nucleus-like isoform X2 [Prosopis alba]
MSSRYPVLDNRPIDQWKVTELKEELKRRKLPVKGLKDDLIRRLDEDLRRVAAEASKKDDASGADLDPQPVGGAEESLTGTTVAKIVNTIETGSDKAIDTAERGNICITEPIERENNEKITEVVGIDCNYNEKLDGVSTPVDANVSVPVMDQEVAPKGLPDGGESKIGDEEQVTPSSTVEPGITVSGSVLTEEVASCQDSYRTETQKENGDSAAKTENEESNVRLESEDQKSQPECDIEPQSMDLMVHSPAPKNQTYPMDVGDPPKEKASLEERSNNITSSDLNKTNGIEDAGYLEKLNLDRSSGEDSMEEDLPESKQFDSKLHDAELRNKMENSEVPIVKEESDSKDVGDVVSAGKDFTHQDSDMHPAVSVEKRKFTDHALPGNNEPAKRVRRWNTEIAKAPAPQSSGLTSATTPKDEPIALKRSFSMSNSSAVDESPRERIVPPPERSPTNSLRIDRFLRPFTLKAVHELLGKTGKVVSFWMDQIKTHCYVTYSSVDEAIETRNAVYNLQWPPNGGRQLLAEFVEPEEVKMKVEAPPVQAVSVSSAPVVPPTPPTSQPEPSPRRHQEQRPVPATLPPPPPLSKPPPAARERLPSPPPLPEKVDPPIVTLDDLFRKTRATPRIYYLPLSEEQVAAKLEAHGKVTKQ